MGLMGCTLISKERQEKYLTVRLYRLWLNLSMDALSDRRLAENEVIFKRLNMEMKDFLLEDGTGTIYFDKPLRFYCECSNLECRERVTITAKQYDDLHVSRKQFIVKPGHAMPEIEDIIEQGEGFMVVEKKKVPPAPKNVDPKLFL